MSEHDHDHGADQRNALRVEALEAILREKGLVDSAQIDALIRHYEENVGPMNGARIVARAWTDPDYRRRLLENATAAAAELGFSGAQSEHLVALENSAALHNVVVCTLCSCYPWPILGLPPSWYKSPAYRSRVVREPRAVLREMGLELADDVQIRVWDSSAEVRYLVLPERPPESAGLDAAALARWVTRDAMIGVGQPRAPALTRP